MGKSLATIAFAVSLVVIFSMALAFSILFYLYSKYKLIGIEHGLEDGTLIKDLEKDYARQSKGNEKMFDWLTRKANGNKRFQRVTNVLYGIMIVCLLIAAGIAIAFRAQGSEIFIGDTAYYTVLTGSMQEKNALNPYYKELPDDGNIEPGTLVAAEKIPEDKIKLYDIIAFRHENKVYIHRIVEIKETEDGKLYTTMGDNNAASYNFERNMPYSKILGKLSGFRNYGIGVTLNYLQSNIGLISMAFAFVMLIFMDWAEGRILKRYQIRLYELAEMFDTGKFNNARNTRGTNIANTVSSANAYNNSYNNNYNNGYGNTGTPYSYPVGKRSKHTENNANYTNYPSGISGANFANSANGVSGNEEWEFYGWIQPGYGNHNGNNGNLPLSGNKRTYKDENGNEWEVSEWIQRRP